MSTEKVCACGKTFRGHTRKCLACRSACRKCSECGVTFNGHTSRCRKCQTVERACACGKTFRGTALKCESCRRVQRKCTECGKTFQGARRKCSGCLSVKRACACGTEYKGTNSQCSGCRAVEKVCDCGRSFRGVQSTCSSCWIGTLEAEARSALIRSKNNTRRARKQAAEVAGPVPASVYLAIRSEGPCVFCGALADTVEHITPLARGGWEHPDNLVPACGSCNFSKGPKLLSEWDPVRVAHAVRTSPKVAAAYTAEMERVS